MVTKKCLDNNNNMLSYWIVKYINYTYCDQKTNDKKGCVYDRMN